MHPLHVLIGKIILLMEMEIPDCRVILGKDCGGNQNIQLFCSENAERATHFCSVDATILLAGQVVAILEIEEEGGIRPGNLFGKVFASAHASHFIDGGETSSIASGCAFVQVIDTGNLPRSSKKLEQCLHLSESIKPALMACPTKLAYQIFYGDLAEFERPEAQQELQDHLRAAICQIAAG